MLQTHRTSKGVQIFINRTYTTTNQQQGILSVIDKNGHIVFTCHTLELPNRNNARNVSQIPRGTYQAFTSYTSEKKGLINFMGVAGRDGIQIHSGNFSSQIQGCVLVGSHFQHLNSDSDIDVVNSRDTLNKLLNVLDKAFFITIN